MSKKLEKQSIKFKGAVPFSYKKINSQYLLVNEWGDFLFLEKKEFDKFQASKLSKDDITYFWLEQNNFIKKSLFLDQVAARYQKKKSYLFAGPGLHIMVVTLRCNHSCIYCHASARGVKEKEYDMSLETAKKALDIIFSTTSHYVAIEFQGGEPLLNWPVVQFIIKEAKKKSKQAKKDLQIRLVTNGSLVTKKILDYLIKQKVTICFSFDGPEELHNKQRCNGPANTYQKIVTLIKEFNKKYPQLKKEKYIWRVSTRLTVTKFSLPLAKEIIDSHIKLGLEGAYLCNLHPYGFSRKSWKKIGYRAEDFLKFYYQAMDYIIDLNLQGKNFRERLAETFLAKILSAEDPNHLDFRSPCGAGIGQLAYHYNGDVYTCDEGRMLAMMNDKSFKLGNVYNNTYHDLVTSPVTKTVCTASCIESLPGCDQCVYQPYCGVCPVYNYFQYGNIFAHMPNNERCKLTKGIMDYLFTKMQDEEIKEILEKWVA